MARSIPVVHSRTLFCLHNGQKCQIAVDTVDWYRWLSTATSFAFTSSQGAFTARRERPSNKRGGWYWKAYARRDGKLHHASLGKDEVLSWERMLSIATILFPNKADSLSSLAEQEAVSLLTVSSDASFPPISISSVSNDEKGNTLPAQLTPFIGREQELAQICTLLLQPEKRLLTITGTGGVGKTRLALQVADQVAADFFDGVHYVSLAPITTPDLIVSAIAQTLGVADSGDRPLLARLKAFLVQKQMLLVLDNFEHIITAASLVADFLACCPTLKIMVTSREVLHIRGEHEYYVSPLALPNIEQVSEIEQISHYAAIALFVQHATTIRPDFCLTLGNALTVVKICARLDGLPLAIELAAARIKFLTPEELLLRLDNRLQILTGGARDVPKRQKTLRDTLAWSYELLENAEQRLFRYLAVFVRGCTLETVEALFHLLSDHTDIVFTHVASLIDKILLQRVEQINGGSRLMMLEIVREYAQECLQLCEEENTLRNAHAAYYLSLVEQAEPAMRTVQQVHWLECLEQEYDNIRSALHWLLKQNNLIDAGRMCCALGLFWLIRDRCIEGYQWSEQVLARNGASERELLSHTLKAQLLSITGILADSQGLYQRAIEAWTESLSLCRQYYQPGAVAVLNRLGQAYARNEPSTAHMFYEQSLEMAKQLDDHYGIADALASLASEASDTSDFEKARLYFEESLTLYTSLGDLRGRAYCLGGLGHIAASIGEHHKASTLLKQSLDLYREVGDRVRVAFTLIPLGMENMYLGDSSTAQNLLNESFIASQKLGNQNAIADYLGHLGEIALYKKGENEAARTLLEESLAIFRATGNEEGIGSKLFALGSIELAQGNLNAARKLLDECESIFRRLAHRTMRASSLYLLGHLEAHRGNYAAAHTFMQESLLLTRQMGDPGVMSARLSHLGLVLLNEGNFTDASLLFEESLQAAYDSGDERYIADVLGVMGLLPLYQHDYPAAEKLLKESLTLSRQRGDRYVIAYRLADLGLLALQQKEIARAHALIEEALIISLQLGNRWFVASCLERLGEVAVELHQQVHAVELWGAAAVIRDAIDAPIPPIERALYEHSVAQAQLHLSVDEFSRAWKKGYTSALEEILIEHDRYCTLPEKKMNISGNSFTAITHFSNRDIKMQQIFNEHLTTAQVYTGSLPPPTKSTQSDRSALLKRLTKREQEILAFLMNGASNREIAQELFLSEGTVKKHVSNICNKLGVERRSQIIMKVLSFP